MRTLLGSWTLGVVVLVSAEAASAQTRPYPECTSEPTESDVAAAKGAFQAGQASFNEADYERAITYWEDAYRRDCTAHALLLNLARAYELSGDKRQAVEALQTYLARKPESPQKDQINRRIEVLNQQIDKEATAVAAAPPPEPAPAPQAAPMPKPPAPQPAPEPTPEPSDSFWVGPAIVGGAGVIAAGTGVVVHAIGDADEDAAAEKCPERVGCSLEVEEQGNDGIFKQKLGVGLMIGGTAAVGGALAWFLLAQPGSGTATPANDTSDKRALGTRAASARPPAGKSAAHSKMFVLPELGPGHAGLSVFGSF